MSLNYCKDADFEEAKTANQAIVPGLVSEMARIAEDHGFTKEKYNKLVFEDWLYSSGSCQLSDCYNLVLIKLDPNSIYFAIVEEVFQEIGYAVAFRIKPKSIRGEGWRYELEVLYIANSDNPSEVFFNYNDYCSYGELIVTTAPVSNEFGAKLKDGVDIRLLNTHLFQALEGLFHLFVLRTQTVLHRAQIARPS